MPSRLEEPNLPVTVLDYAECVIKLGAQLLSGLGSVSNGSGHGAGYWVATTPLAVPVGPFTDNSEVHLLGTFDCLVNKAREAERNFAEGLGAFTFNVRHCSAFRKDEDGNVGYGQGIVIDDDGTPLFIDIESELVFDALRADVERPLRDRIRVSSQIVGLLCNEVRFFRGDHRVLREHVGFLSSLVSQASVDEAAESDQ